MFKKMNSTFRFCVNGIFNFSFMNYSVMREARILNRMLKRNLNKQKSEINIPGTLIKKNLASAYENEGCNKRMTALNKIYMERITEMFHSGKYSSELANLQIQISKVRITKGFNFINIYYISKSFETSDDVVIDTLKKVLSEIQGNIGSLNYFSKMPYLRFIKDLRLEKEIYLDKIFEKIDFGKDYEVTHPKTVITPDYASNTSLPIMRQDVLGLDHAGIKEKITADILKFKAINTSEKLEEREEKHPGKLIQFSKKEFFKFYKQRRIAELKARKNSRRDMNSFDLHDVNAYEEEI